MSRRRYGYIVTIGAQGERWGRYRELEHAKQAQRALLAQGFEAHIESATLYALLRRLEEIDELAAGLA